MKRVSVFLYFLLAACPFLGAEEVTYEIRHYSVGDGLSDHRVYCILQHSSGFVWVGTEDGVNRFDGYRFFPLSFPELPHLDEKPLSSRVLNLTELKNGMILVESAEEDNTRESYFLLNPETLKFHSRIFRVSEPDTWCYASGSDTIYLDQDQRKPGKTFPYGQDTLGNRFVFTKDRIAARIIYNSGEVLDLSSDWLSLSNPSSPVGNNFEELFYIRHLNGLVKVTINSSAFESFLNKDLGDWEYGLNGRSMIKLNPDLLLFSPERYAPVLVNINTGASEPYIIRNRETGQPVPSTSIRGMYHYNDSTIIATSVTGTIFSFNWKTRETESYHRGYYRNILHSTLLNNGRLLVAGQPNHPDEPSLSLFDPVTSVLTPLDFKYRFHWPQGTGQCFLLESGNRTAWLGTVNGLYRLDLGKNTVIEAFMYTGASHETGFSFPVHKILKSPIVLVLHEDENGNLWVGTENGGLQVLGPKGNNFLEVDADDGLSDNTVCGIVPGKDGLWISTYHGLNYLEKKPWSIRTFYTESGLPHNEFNRFSFYRESDHEIYLGTMNGFCSFNPDDLLNSSTDVFLLLSEARFFEPNGKTQKVIQTYPDNGPPLSISSTNRSCAFRMALNHHAHPESNTFAYALEPASGRFNNEQTQWRQNGKDRQIRFEYLPAGRYTLRVRATSLAGMVPGEFRINLHVREVFYKTAWFVTLSGFLFISIVYTFYRFRLNNAIRLEQLKTRLSSDLHDDVGSVLSGVAYQMELLEYSVEDENKTLVRQIAASSRQAMSRMRDVVWAIDSRNHTFLDLTERMKEFADELLFPLGIRCTFDFSSLPLKKDVPAPVRHDLLLIFKEFLTNSVKHADADHIRVKLGMEGGSIELLLRDNGQGLQKDPGKVTGQGLKNMRMRARKLNASFRILEGDGFGIEVKT